MQRPPRLVCLASHLSHLFSLTPLDSLRVNFIYLIVNQGVSCNPCIGTGIKGKKCGKYFTHFIPFIPPLTQHRVSIDLRLINSPTRWVLSVLSAMWVIRASLLCWTVIIKVSEVKPGEVNSERLRIPSRVLLCHQGLWVILTPIATLSQPFKTVVTLVVSLVVNRVKLSAQHQYAVECEVAIATTGLEPTNGCD